MCICLPRFEGSAEHELPVRTHPFANTGDGEVVMVIDDESAVRALVVELLDEAGYTAIEAADGASGLRMMDNVPRVDPLIADVGLPGRLNGHQVADAARVKRPQLKVLFITG